MVDPISWALEQARRDLIDLTRRNRLLHAPLEGKRPWCLAVSGQSPDELFAKLYRQENFRGYAFSARVEDTNAEQVLPAIHTTPLSDAPNNGAPRRPRLQTRLPPDKLQRRLTKIFREERTLEEEQGLSTLYLALGFLKWFDTEHSTDESLAPLILVPVTLARVGGSEGYLLRGRDDDIIANISLREKLKTNFDINFPELPEDDDWKPSSYFQKVSREVRRQARWAVDVDAVGLGFFTFSKFLMWRDLHPASWPANALLEHPLVKILLHQGEEFESYPPIVADDELIDQRIDISKCIHVVDADSSQAVVIEEVTSGRNLVVQGPPGTVKSQTITNAIAAAAHSGKTVLFVAEKTAALEVVHDRLRKAGLDALCLEIHSRKANKRTVVKSLDHALQFSSASLSDDEIGTRLAARRDKLNRWSNALHKQVANSGRTGFEIIGWQVKLRSDGVRLLEQSLDDAANWDATKIASVEVALDRAATAVRNLGIAPNDHIWFGTNLDTQSPFDLQRLIPVINTAVDKISALEKETLKVIAAMEGIDEPSLGDALAAIKSLRHVAAVPKQARHILASSAWVQSLTELRGK